MFIIIIYTKQHACIPTFVFYLHISLVSSARADSKQTTFAI